MEFLNEFKANASSGNFYYVFYIFAVIAVFILLKGRRVKFVVPAILLSLFVFNPVTYRYWGLLGLYAYWRIIWIIPVIPMCATLPAVISEKINDKRVKTFENKLDINELPSINKF